MIGMGARDFYLKKPQAMAGQDNLFYNPTATKYSKIAENSPKAERERERKKTERKSFSRTRLLNNLRCAHVLRTTPVLN